MTNPSASTPGPIVGVALDAVGPHQATRRLVDLALDAERMGIDFVSLDDTLDPRSPEERPVRLDALLTLAHVAAATTSIGLLATVTVTHTEPFHVSKNIATLDLVSGGRAGWQVSVSTTEEAAARFGRRPTASPDDLYAEADDVVEVVRKLWDSWEDDAVIRDRPTGRYIDRAKVHYVDFAGRFFDVRGPSITPRPPQGQPIVAAKVDDSVTLAFAARSADLVFVDTADADIVRARRDELSSLAVGAGRAPDALRVLAVVPLDGTTTRTDAATLAGWFAEGNVDGFLLQPSSLADGLDAIGDLIPVLGGDTDPSPLAPGQTLRERFGLDRPANRYAPAGVAR
jgi:alkanesulfonate monooxygenase SsuD/methylene tetrahydromethanopterin reductase-like flavin-dependent oxidoreductase (luciferase family)